MAAVACQNKRIEIPQRAYSIDCVTSFGRCVGAVTISGDKESVVGALTGYYYAENAGDTQETISVSIHFSEGSTSSFYVPSLSPGGYTPTLDGNTIRASEIRGDVLYVQINVTGYSNGSWFTSNTQTIEVGRVPA